MDLNPEVGGETSLFVFHGALVLGSLEPPLPDVIDRRERGSLHAYRRTAVVHLPCNHFIRAQLQLLACSTWLPPRANPTGCRKQPHRRRRRALHFGGAALRFGGGGRFGLSMGVYLAAPMVVGRLSDRN